MTGIPCPAGAWRGRAARAISGAFLAAILSACAPVADDPHDDRHDDDHGEDAVVHLTAEQRALAGVTVAPARRATLDAFIDLPGEVRFDEDRLAHAGVRAAGAVVRLHAGEGDFVTAGQILAEIDIRDLADARAGERGARAALTFAEADYERAARLYESDAVSRQEYERAREAREAARIELARAGQQVAALGVSGDSGEVDAAGARYALRAPISGRVIARQAVLGEMLELENPKPVFIIADPSRVWIDAQTGGGGAVVVAEGDAVQIDPGDGAPPLDGRIAFISPDLDSRTRTARLRAVAENPDGRLRPGQFVSVRAPLPDRGETLTIPASALVVMNGHDVLFVETGEDEYAPRNVRVGRRAGTVAEILGGLAEGERVVVEGAFTLWAEMEKDGFGDGHDH